MSQNDMASMASEHGLSEEEYLRILKILNREPNLLELGIFSVMWSEHCSYKSSKKWLKTLPVKGDASLDKNGIDIVIQGPGENAGVIDIGGNMAAIFKIESHNHPSFIEPYQGAATGVGGILRDVFTMGARPIASLNALRFGDPNHPKTRHLIGGVVGGIGGYGNSFGVPTIAGETDFDIGYNGNNLVNAMTIGLAQKDRIFYAKATGIGNPVVYVGAKTGRDGIHGATMASAEFDEDSDAKRPTVQVGDPFTEKLLLEACLELMAEDVIIAIQDMGAAGLTSSSVEMASKGELGIDLWLDKVPMRETGMTPYELMLSESQERMLMVLKPGQEDVAKTIFHKWGLDFAIIGCLNDSGNICLFWNEENVADIPLGPLVEQAPEYDRPYILKPRPDAIDEVQIIAKTKGVFEDLMTIMASPQMASKRWIYEQYDGLIGGQTLQPSGGDAGVIKIAPEGVEDDFRALACAVDCTHRYVAAYAHDGGIQAVAESWRNLTAMGARPLAITNNLNFGNPERPEIMGDIVGAINGIGEAAKRLNYPIISGNVSLYNETGKQAIPPTPVIGGVGLIDDYRFMARPLFQEGQYLYLIGDEGQHMAQSRFAQLVAEINDGPPPAMNLSKELQNGNFVRDVITKGMVKSCHDISDGGLLVSVAEMALASHCGVELCVSTNIPMLFGEDQARYVIAIDEEQQNNLREQADKVAVKLTFIGKTGGDALRFEEHSLALDVLRKAHESWLPNYMNPQNISQKKAV